MKPSRAKSDLAEKNKADNILLYHLLTKAILEGPAASCISADNDGDGLRLLRSVVYRIRSFSEVDADGPPFAAVYVPLLLFAVICVMCRLTLNDFVGSRSEAAFGDSVALATHIWKHTIPRHVQ